MNGLNGPKGNNFDESFITKGVAYNTQRSGGKFLQQRAEWQVTRLAVMHGMWTGIVYGGSAGLAVAVYKRQMRYIPYGALLLGVPYATGLAWSTIYRMDV